MCKASGVGFGDAQKLRVALWGVRAMKIKRSGTVGVYIGVH